MLSFGATEEDLSVIRLDDVNLSEGTVRLRAGLGSDVPRVQGFVTTCAGRSSREIFERYLEFRGNLVRWVRLNNRGMVEPVELLVYDRGAGLFPFKVGSTSMTNRLKEIGRASGVRVTEGRILGFYTRNLFYRDENLADMARIASMDPSAGVSNGARP